MRRKISAWLFVLGLVLPPAAHADDDSGVDNGVPRFLLHGFSDVTLTVADHPKPTRAAFGLGQFNLFFVSNLAPDVSFLAETVFELEEDNEQVLDVERVLIQYARSDYARLTFGRVHTAVGYWNTFYHHGAWLQPTIQRPTALHFEDDGGVLPVHSVGGELSGRVARGVWSMAYVGGVANGRGPRADIVQGTTDVDREKALTGRISLLHTRDSEFEFGISGGRDHVPVDPLDSRRGALGEQWGGVHARWESVRWTLVAEAWALRHHDLDLETEATHRAGYGLAIAKFGALKPYVLADVLDVDARDVFFEQSHGRRVGALGVRYDIGTFNAIKVEVRREKHAGQVTNVLAAQTAFTF